MALISKTSDLAPSSGAVQPTAGTDVLLVNLPPYESYFAAGVPHLGLLYIATCLRHHGYTVSYLDCSPRRVRHSQVRQWIRDVHPKVVGLSVDTDSLPSAANLSHELRSEFGDQLRILFGGPASQGEPKEIMQRSAADVLVIGEGEYSAPEVTDSWLRNKGRLEDVAGICFRRGGELVFTPPRPPISDLDAIPFPDRSFLPPGRDYEATIITGRGCPFRCTFCFEGRMGNEYRHRSPENVVGEIEYLVQHHGRPFISINDDTFTANPDHALRVCSLLQQRLRPLQDYSLFCEVRVDVVRRRPELIDALVKAGVVRIQVGVESADRDLLRAYKRLNVNPDVVEEVIGNFHRAGMLSVYCGFILGGPGETQASMQRTLDFARRLLLEVAPGSFECAASFLTPLPGTELRNSPNAFGLRLIDPDLLTTSNFNFCVAETPTLTQGAINNFHADFGRQIDQWIGDLIPRLPRSVIERHARLLREFNVRTRYAERFQRYPRMLEYYDMVAGTALEPASELDDEQVLNRFPTRHPFPVRMEGGHTTITHGPNDIRLNRTGSLVFAHCSGKLRTREIAATVRATLSQEGADVSLEQAQRDVVQLVRHLDEHYAVFLKDY